MFSGTFPCLNFQVGSPYVGSSSNNTGASRMSAPAMNDQSNKNRTKRRDWQGLIEPHFPFIRPSLVNEPLIFFGLNGHKWNKNLELIRSAYLHLYLNVFTTSGAKTTTMPRSTCQGQTLSFTTRPHIRSDSQNFFKSNFWVSTATHHPGQLEHHSPAAWCILQLWHRVTAKIHNRGPILDFTKLWAEAALAASSQNVEKSLGHKPQLKKWRKQKGLQAVHLQTIYRLWLRSDCRLWLRTAVLITLHIDTYWLYFYLFFICAPDPKAQHLDALGRHRVVLRPEPLKCGEQKRKAPKISVCYVVKLVKVMIWWFLFYMKSSAKSGLAPRAL